MYKTVSDFVSQESVEGKKVLVRVDFNVPMDENKRILDTTRIDETIPTIHLLCEHGAIVILLSHLGRPSCRDPRFSLEPVAIYLQKLTSYCVFFSMDCRGLETKSLCERMYPSNILVLENLRFYKEEEENNCAGRCDRNGRMCEKAWCNRRVRTCSVQRNRDATTHLGGAEGWRRVRTYLGRIGSARIDSVLSFGYLEILVGKFHSAHVRAVYVRIDTEASTAQSRVSIVHVSKSVEYHECRAGECDLCFVSKSKG